MIHPSLVRPSAAPSWRKKDDAPDVGLSDANGTIRVALSIVLLAYAGLGPILVFYAVWFSLLSYKGKFRFLPTGDMMLCLGLGLYALASIFWSDYPKVCMRAALEMLSMLCCTMLMTRLVSVRAFLRGLMAGTSLSLGVILFFRYALSIELYGSKNQIAFIAEIGLLASILHFFSREIPRAKSIFALGCLLFTGYCFVGSRSGTAVVSLVATMGVLWASHRLGALQPRYRGPAIIALIVFLGAVSWAGSVFEWQKIGLGLLGKDATLTGRTYLWSEGMRTGWEMPILGRGYVSFWVPGQPEAEKYWAYFQEPSGSGFHFHNLYIQTFVDLGAIGVLWLVFMLFFGCFKSLQLVVRQGASLSVLAPMAFAFMFLTRSMAEVDLLGPFGLGPFVFYGLIPRLMKAEPAKTPPPPEPRPQRIKPPLRRLSAKP